MSQNKIGSRLTVLSIAVVAFVIGGLFLGNAFTLITGEVGGLGPGAFLNTSFKLDTIVSVTTSSPERYMSDFERVLAPATRLIWAWTGRMVHEPGGRYTITLSRHAGVLTNDGKDWLEDQISDSPSTTPAAYIGLTSSAHTPAATDHKLWGEIDTGGTLDRQLGTYASTGVGTWTVTKSISVDATYTNVQATGLYWSDTDSTNNTMLASDTFATCSPISGDTLNITWTNSAS